MAEQPSDEEKAEIEQKKKKQKYKKAEEARIEAERIAEDERIDNRFDILDMQESIMKRFFKWFKLKFHKCVTYPRDRLWGGDGTQYCSICKEKIK